MLEVAAVLFTITIPTAAEEQRLKEAYVRNLSEDGTATTSTTTTTTTTTTKTTTTTATSSQRSTLSSSGDELSLSRSPPRCESSGTTSSQLSTPPRNQQQKQLTDVTGQRKELHQMPLDTAMEYVLQQILRKFQIENAMWVPNREGNTYQITFTLAFNELYENLYDALQQWGIGDREGSTVSVMNCIASKSYVNNREQSDKQPAGDTNSE